MGSTQPIRLALVNDYEVVLAGVARMFDQYRDRIQVMELDANQQVADHVDIALYDTFGQPEADHDEVRALIDNPHAVRAVVYTWNFDQELIDAAMSKGSSGYLSKQLPAHELVEALEAIHAGELVVSPVPPPESLSVGQDWPGRAEGLTEREGEILALITQGKSNAEIAGLVFLSINTIKTYIRSTYRKIGVTTRVQAVLWGLDHGFSPVHCRIDAWRMTS